MAEKEQTQDEVVTEKRTTSAVTRPGANQVAVVPRHSRKWILGVVAAVVVLYIIIAAAGLWFLHEARNHSGAAVTGPNTATRQFGAGRFSSERTFRATETSSDGLTTTSTTTTYTQTQGVVTAVNSDNIVVAGGGKTQTIKTNGSTTYAGDTKPAVNDTVVVVGTKDGDTITATQIAVYN